MSHLSDLYSVKCHTCKTYTLLNVTPVKTYISLNVTPVKTYTSLNVTPVKTYTSLNVTPVSQELSTFSQQSESSFVSVRVVAQYYDDRQTVEIRPVFPLQIGQQRVV